MLQSTQISNKYVPKPEELCIIPKTNLIAGDGFETPWKGGIYINASYLLPKGESIVLKRILIADDQMATREALAKHAENRGYEAVTVTSGEELLEIISEERFDVVITDIIMPDFNGAVATDIIKLQGSKTPVIAMTGLTPEEMDVVDTEFLKVFHKPIKADELFDYVDALLQK